MVKYMKDQFWGLPSKVHYVWLSAASWNYKKSSPSFTKQIILYQFMIRNLYHPVLVAVVWLLKKLEIFESLSDFQGSATITTSVSVRSSIRDGVIIIYYLRTFFLSQFA